MAVENRVGGQLDGCLWAVSPAGKADGRELFRITPPEKVGGAHEGAQEATQEPTHAAELTCRVTGAAMCPKSSHTSSWPAPTPLVLCKKIVLKKIVLRRLLGLTMGSECCDPESPRHYSSE